MSGMKGINVAKLAWLGSHGGPKTRINLTTEGWTAVPASGPENDAEISRGANPEEAAAARIELLESLGIFVPEPPADYVERVTRE